MEPAFSADQGHTTLRERALKLYDAVKARGLDLNMARGKPSTQQLDLVGRLLELPGREHYRARDGLDCRNYGCSEGIPEARVLFSKLLGAAPENTIVAGNSSLALMHDAIVFSLLKGNPDSPRPWCRESAVRFLCPVPGYDYHFHITDAYDIGMIPVPLLEDGPDMDAVESLVQRDASIKGMWCVPKYSNPTGTVYGDATIERLARMRTAAPDFRIFWDNAYAIHHLTGERVEIANMLDACARAGHPNRAFVFASTSKISFPGAGVAAFAGSHDNVAWFLDRSGKRCIGPDKINQLRHVAAFPDEAALHALMDQYRQILAPKFQVVRDTFQEHLGAGLASWTNPRGGYFISLYTPPGCARRAVELAATLGVTLTPAGAAFPHGHDPRDSHIRIAPTQLALDQVAQAAEAVVAAVLMAASEHKENARG